MKTSQLSPTAWLSESLEGRTWLLLLNWYQAPTGDSLRRQIPAPCPHSPPPPHGIYIDRCIRRNSSERLRTSSDIIGPLRKNLGTLKTKNVTPIDVKRLAGMTLPTKEPQVSLSLSTKYIYLIGRFSVLYRGKFLFWRAHRASQNWIREARQ